MAERAPLPASCAECAFRPAPSGLCRRHAPHVTGEEFEVAYWPRVRPTDRCGQGAAVGDGSGPGVIACEACIHWLQPGGEPVHPDYRKGLATEWWAESGYCTLHAPAPSADEEQRVFWRVTHASAGCGDGRAVPLSEAEGETEAEPEEVATA